MPIFSRTNVSLLSMVLIVPLAYNIYTNKDTKSKVKKNNARFRITMDTSKLITPEEHEALVERNIGVLLDGIKDEIESYLEQGRVQFHVPVDTADNGLLHQLALSVQTSLRNSRYKNAICEKTNDNRLFIDTLGLQSSNGSS